MTCSYYLIHFIFNVESSQKFRDLLLLLLLFLSLSRYFYANVELYAIDLRNFQSCNLNLTAREMRKKSYTTKRTTAFCGCVWCLLCLLSWRSIRWERCRGHADYDLRFFVLSIWNGSSFKWEKKERWYIEYAIEFNDQDLSLPPYSLHGINRLDSNVYIVYIYIYIKLYCKSRQIQTDETIA